MTPQWYIDFITRLHYLSFTSKLDKNLNKLLSTPEGTQELENALLAWEENVGEEPTSDDLEAMTTVVLRNNSLFYEILSTATIIIFLIVFVVMAYQSCTGTGPCYDY